MGGRDGGTQIEPGIIARVSMGLRYLFTGDAPAHFFGPGQPIAPVAQQAAEGRAFDFPVGYNIQTQPRAGEAITFPQLRGLADSYDLLRLAIETRKDQMSKLTFVIKPKDGSQPGDDAKEIQDFLGRPDQEHDWDDWIRMWLEEVFVTDAPAIYRRKNLGGSIYALELIDGATIKRVLSADGRTPAPPDPAYQQVIKGLAAADYTRDELLYVPRNPRASRIYGYSPVEQIIMTVNIALRRQVKQLSYYTEGNIPSMLAAVPTTWSTDQIEKFQKYWDLLMSGDLAKLQKVKFVPGDLKVQPTHTEKLFDETDEWLARVVCYAMNLPPNAFVKQQNRATAGSAQEIALEEGLAPIMRYVAVKMTRIVNEWFGKKDLEFAWEDQADVDPLVQAQIDDLNVKNKTKKINEVREDRGDPPLSDEELAEATAPPPSPFGNPTGINDPTGDGSKPTKTKGNPDGVTAAAAEKVSKRRSLRRAY